MGGRGAKSSINKSSSNSVTGGMSNRKLEKLDKKIDDANLSGTVNNYVKNAFRMYKGSSSDKERLVESLTEQVTYSDLKGHSIRSGFAQYMFDSFQMLKKDENGYIPVKTSYDEIFRSFLYLVDEGKISLNKIK